MNSDPTNPLDAAHFSAIGPCPVFVRPADAPVLGDVQAIKIGVDRAGNLCCGDTDAFDILLTTQADAPAPWMSVTVANIDAYAESLAARVRQSPIAATTLARVLRIGERSSFQDALHIESLAYSTLLGGAEFGRWLDGRPSMSDVAAAPDALVLYDRDDDHVTLTLNNPLHSNAMTAAMRDALYTALANILDDPSQPTVTIRAAGRCFSSGGHLPEFGSARDLAEAHVVRTVHSCARLIHRLGDRATVQFHGAAIGSGLEGPAAAAHRVAADDAWFQLPEVSMGLIPGAGGTATVSRAIGRHRTMWMAISGKRIGAKTALSLGLIHAIVAK